MKNLCIVIGIMMVLCLAGCYEEIALVSGGVALNAAAMEEKTKSLEEKWEKLKAKEAEVEVMGELVKSIAEKYDPNQLALLDYKIRNFLMVDVNSPDFSTHLNSAIASYNAAHGSWSKVKKESKDTSNWIALGLAVIAGYQKRQRMKGK